MKYIYFGSYPQMLVTDEELIKELKENTDASFNVMDYGYYIEGKQEKYMVYGDIELDGNKYRGVLFKKYRPFSTIRESSKDTTYQDNNGYYTANFYFFKWEPIKWNVLKEENGKALIVADLILDSQDYYWYDSTSSHFHNGGTGYSNNYELSHIRQWLNYTFYNYAFTNEEKELILDTDVDNSPKSIVVKNNKYACDNTKDKIFLLSNSEAKTYFANYISRQVHGTDYAKCQGLQVFYGNYSFWWLRSPCGNYGLAARLVDNGGYIYSYSVNYASYGVRPAMWINL